MNAQDLRLKLSNEANRLNFERARLQKLDEEWQEKKVFVERLDGAVQTLQNLVQEAENIEKAGLERANELAKAAEAATAQQALPNA